MSCPYKKLNNVLVMLVIAVSTILVPVNLFILDKISEIKANHEHEMSILETKIDTLQEKHDP